jgi:hypothetical protein
LWFFEVPEEDGLSMGAIGKLLGRKKSWISRRLLLARKLDSNLQGLLDHA